MNEKPKKHLISKQHLSCEIRLKAVRKLKAQHNTSAGVWFGLGMMGLIGWSVVVPTLIGTVIGIWIDNEYAGGISWTLTLLLIGLIVGCLNVWYWMVKEEKEMQKKYENNYE
jgi:ATP synthase protein I